MDFLLLFLFLVKGGTLNPNTDAFFLPVHLVFKDFMVWQTRSKPSLPMAICLNIDQACFCTTVTELSSCNGDLLPIKLKILTI